MAKKKAKAKGKYRSAGTGKSAAADWRTGTLDEVRRMIVAADPEIVEERKWIKPTNPAGVPVWSHGGIVCTGETYKEVVKLTFFRGAALRDPNGLFNAGFAGGTRRAIDIREGEKFDPKAFMALIHEAVEANFAASAPKSKAAPKKVAKVHPVARATRPVKLLSGGNPQIAKADGEAPVQDYIAAMPGWKRAIGQRLDELIVQAVPNVRKAVKWNSPLYGVEGQGWFLGFHVFTRYVKVTFFFGRSLEPMPPGPSKDQNARYLDIHEHDEIDEKQFVSWIRQAAAIPGWDPGKRA